MEILSTSFIKKIFNKHLLCLGTGIWWYIILTRAELSCNFILEGGEIDDRPKKQVSELLGAV